MNDPIRPANEQFLKRFARAVAGRELQNKAEVQAQPERHTPQGLLGALGQSVPLRGSSRVTISCI